MVWQQRAVLGITAFVFLRFPQPKRATDEGCVCPPSHYVYPQRHVLFTRPYTLMSSYWFHCKHGGQSHLMLGSLCILFCFLISRAQSCSSGANFLTSSSIKTLFVPRLCVIKLLSSCGGKSSEPVCWITFPQKTGLWNALLLFFSPHPPLFTLTKWFWSLHNLLSPSVTYTQLVLK